MRRSREIRRVGEGDDMMLVLHEVGHHFGLSDDQLRELGWA
ncbi:MAG TPA: metallopeptidase family protein [Acidimicrobiia bacterium]|nr:metallopeptidase family protein [Acidimicrobiia bacterium]